MSHLPTGSGDVPEHTPLGVPLPGRVRRSSAAGRATAAVAAESFPLSLNPSPLIRPRDPVTFKTPVVHRKLPSGQVAAPKISETEVKMAEMRRVLTTTTAPPPKCTVTPLTNNILRLIFEFTGNTPKQLKSIAKTCSSWRIAAFPCVTEVTLVPDCTSIDKLSQVGAMASLGEYFSVPTRGQYMKRFTVNDPSHIYSLPNTTFGPTLAPQAISVVLMNMPQLKVVDLRGIQLRNFAPWCDHLLSDLASHCPQVEKLAIGPCFIRNWEVQWWHGMSKLSHFTIGSRREDHDWSTSGKPLTLAEDFFTMLRTSTTLKSLKMWCTLATPSFTQLLLPGIPFPSLTHLSINAFGNTQIKPIEEQAPTENVAADKGKKDPKAKKGAEEPQQQKVGFPSLVSLAVADVKDRPEFLPELIVRLGTSAPQLQFISAVNTHRNAPGHVQPVVAKPTRVRPAVGA